MSYENILLQQQTLCFRNQIQNLGQVSLQDLEFRVSISSGDDPLRWERVSRLAGGRAGGSAGWGWSIMYL